MKRLKTQRPCNLSNQQKNEASRKDRGFSLAAAQPFITGYLDEFNGMGQFPRKQHICIPAHLIVLLCALIKTFIYLGRAKNIISLKISGIKASIRAWYTNRTASPHCRHNLKLQISTWKEVSE